MHLRRSGFPQDVRRNGSQLSRFAASRNSLTLLGFLLLGLLAGNLQVAAQSRVAAEQKIVRYFESIKTQPLELYAFLRQMPKGGDLHLHLSGSIYAETFIEWAASAKPALCVNPATFALGACDDTFRLPASQALRDGVLYRRMVDTWSMRNAQLAGLSGHDQFFDAFAKFGSAGNGRFGEMVADVAKRAASERVSYLELMLTPDNGKSREAGRKQEWPSDEEINKLPVAELTAFLAKKREELLAGGILQPLTGSQTSVVQETKVTLDQLEAQQREALNCADAAKANPACRLTIRYVFQVARSLPLREAFAQMVGAMEVMKADARVVALNLVQPEDARAAMNNFTSQMRMLDYLSTLQEYQNNNITLHAGELAPGLVPPEGLRFHIRDSVRLGHAKRIGHGVDVMYEDNPYELLKEMAAKRVLVEVCLTSNDGILGVRGKEHPLPIYLKHGVPVALATDDLGISRSEMTQEYAKAVKEQGIGYLQLKTMARNSLEHAFIGGESFWKDAKRFVPAPACRNALPGLPVNRLPSACQRFLESNNRARLQWELEMAFAQFEKTAR
jgi:adenosine deaminase